MRTKEIAHVHLAGDGVTALYTVPDGKTVIIKEVAMVQNYTQAVDSWLYVTRGGVSQALLKQAALMLANGVVVHQRYIVLEAGDVLSLYNTNGTAGSIGVSVWCSGSELAGVAP